MSLLLIHYQHKLKFLQQIIEYFVNFNYLEKLRRMKPKTKLNKKNLKEWLNFIIQVLRNEVLIIFLGKKFYKEKKIEKIILNFIKGSRKLLGFQNFKVQILKDLNKLKAEFLMKIYFFSEECHKQR